MPRKPDPNNNVTGTRGVRIEYNQSSPYVARVIDVDTGEELKWVLSVDLHLERRYATAQLTVLVHSIDAVIDNVEIEQEYLR